MNMNEDQQYEPVVPVRNDGYHVGFMVIFAAMIVTVVLLIIVAFFHNQCCARRIAKDNKVKDSTDARGHTVEDKDL